MRLLTVALILAATAGGAVAQDRVAPGPLNLFPRAEPPPQIPAPDERPIAAAVGPLGPMLLVGNADGFEVPDTVIVVTPANPVKFGSVIGLDVKPMGTRPKGLFSVTYLWRLHPTPSDLIHVGGTQSFFGAGVEDLTVNVELIACYLFVDKDANNKPIVAQRLVVVDRDVLIGKGNIAPVEPVGPNPAPVLPDSPLGLTKLAAAWISAVTITNSTTKKADAKALARSFRGIASTIASGVDYNLPDGNNIKLDDPGKIIRATKNGNNAAIAATIPQWKPWFINLNGKLDELKAAGKLATVADYTAAWNELAAGLEAVAQ